MSSAAATCAAVPGAGAILGKSLNKFNRLVQQYVWSRIPRCLPASVRCQAVNDLTGSAFVRAVSGAKASTPEIAQCCREGLVARKVARHAVGELPHTPIGKVLKVRFRADPSLRARAVDLG